MKIELHYIIGTLLLILLIFSSIYYIQNGNKFTADNDTEKAIKEKAEIDASLKEFHLAHPSLPEEYPQDFAVAYETEDKKFCIVRGNIGNYSIHYKEGDGKIYEEFIFSGDINISAFSYDRDTSNIILPYDPASVELVFSIQQGVDIRETPSRLVKASIIDETNKSKTFSLKELIDKRRTNETGSYHEMWVGQQHPF